MNKIYLLDYIKIKIYTIIMSSFSDYTEQIIKFTDGKEIISFFKNLVDGIINKKKNQLIITYIKVYSLVLQFMYPKTTI